MCGECSQGSLHLKPYGRGLQQWLQHVWQSISMATLTDLQMVEIQPEHKVAEVPPTACHSRAPCLTYCLSLPLFIYIWHDRAHRDWPFLMLISDISALEEVCDHGHWSTNQFHQSKCFPILIFHFPSIQLIFANAAVAWDLAPPSSMLLSINNRKCRVIKWSALFPLSCITY